MPLPLLPLGLTWKVISMAIGAVVLLGGIAWGVSSVVSSIREGERNKVELEGLRLAAEEDKEYRRRLEEAREKLNGRIRTERRRAASLQARITEYELDTEDGGPPAGCRIDGRLACLLDGGSDGCGEGAGRVEAKP